MKQFLGGIPLLATLFFCAQTPIFAAESLVPLPPVEAGLHSFHGEPYFTVGDKGQTLEGAIYAPNGDLLFCNPTDHFVMRLTPDRKLSVMLELDDAAPGGLALHEDGRLFIAAIDSQKGRGKIVALSPDGGVEEIIPFKDGYLPNDLVFDKHGGFYFSDFRGSATKPLGGVYYVSPDFKTISPVIPHMAQANGVALSPDGRTLWATEYAAGRLHRAELAGPASVPLTGSKIPYYFTGAAPDSMRVDSGGNVYVAMVGLGKVLIFNKLGLPIGQILLDDRDKGLNLRSTSLAVHPQRLETLIVAGNVADASSKEAGIFRGPALAPGLPVPGQKSK